MDLLSSLLLLEFERKVAGFLADGLAGMERGIKENHSALTFEVNFKRNIETLAAELKDTDPYNRSFAFVSQEAQRLTSVFPQAYDYIVCFVGTVSTALPTSTSQFFVPELYTFVCTLWTCTCEIPAPKLLELASRASTTDALVICVRKSLASLLPADEAVKTMQREMQVVDTPKKVADGSDA